jgi:hypothetical protein
VFARLTPLTRGARQAGGGDVTLEDVLRTLALVAAGKLPPRGRESHHRFAAPLPPPPLPESAWDERAAGDGGLTEMHADFAFLLCAPAPSCTNAPLCTNGCKC